jgi:hypothetical protein
MKTIMSTLLALGVVASFAGQASALDARKFFDEIDRQGHGQFIDWKELDRQGHGGFIDWKELDRQGHGGFIDWKTVDQQGHGG